MQKFYLALLATIVVSISMMLGCESVRQAQTPAPTPATPFQPTAIEDPSIHNFYQVTPRLYSGSQPEGDAAFAELQKLGVKAIISVDGAIPDVEAAKAKGIRYIHLPIGYDDVPREQALLLAKAMNEVAGPVFVHCHHGKHRGPAAVGVCAIADGTWTNEQAVDWMNKAGTSKDYAGLFDSVGKFKKPEAATLAKVTGPLPEKAAVPPMAKAMVTVDERWERLLAARKVGFKNVPGHADIEPSHEALQLAELFREMARQADAQALGDDFTARLAQADAEAMELHTAIKAWKESRYPPQLLTVVEAKADVVAKSCKTCHVRHRN